MHWCKRFFVLLTVVDSILPFPTNSKPFSPHSTQLFCSSSSQSTLLSTGSPLPLQVSDMSQASTKCNDENYLVLYPDGRHEQRGFLEDADALIFDCDGTLVMELFITSRGTPAVSFLSTPVAHSRMTWQGGFYAYVAGELASHVCAFQHLHDGPRLPSSGRPADRRNAAEHLQGAGDRGTQLRGANSTPALRSLALMKTNIVDGSSLSPFMHFTTSHAS